MSGRVDEVMMRDMKEEIYGFLCLAGETTLHPRGHVVSSTLQWAIEDGSKVRHPIAVIVIDYEIGNEMGLP